MARIGQGDMHATMRVIIYAMQDSQASKRLQHEHKSLKVWFTHADILRLTGLSHTPRAIRQNMVKLEELGIVELQRENWRNSSTICLYALTTVGENSL